MFDSNIIQNYFIYLTGVSIIAVAKSDYTGRSFVQWPLIISDNTVESKFDHVKWNNISSDRRVFIYQIQGECCGIYGANCPEWIISMEVNYLQIFTLLSIEFFLKKIKHS
jgi:hypothetical protein